MNITLEGRRAKRDRANLLHARVVGDNIQTSEVREFIKSQKKRKWYLLKRKQLDLSNLNMARYDLRGLDLRKGNFYRANLENADLILANVI